MNSLVVYESSFGNTERIAQAVHAYLATAGDARIVAVGAAEAALADVPELLVVGGPTQRHRMSPTLEALLRALPRRSLRGVSGAAFDTRYDMNPFLSGSAARQIERLLRRAGCRTIVSPESFFITMDRPPEGKKRRHDVEELASGELQRARAWAETLLPSR